MKKSKKSTKAEVHLRVLKVYELLLAGNSRSGIIQHGQETWGVGEDQIDWYLRDAREWIEKSMSEQRHSALRLSIERRTNLYRLALENENYWLALEILKDLDRLRGLYPSERFEHGLHGKIETEESKIDFSKITTKQLIEIAEFSERMKKK